LAIYSSSHYNIKERWELIFMSHSATKKAYWIVSLDVINQYEFSEYASRTPQALKKYGGTFLCQAGQFSLVEGAFRTRNTIIEFPSYEAALNCWNSEEYQNARAFREEAAEIDIVIVEGC
jgi:uncharacterized protein (DUF1330 family)